MKKITLSVAALALAINTYSQEFFDVTPYLKDNDSVFVDYNFRDVDTTDLVNVLNIENKNNKYEEINSNSSGSVRAIKLRYE